MVIMRKWTQPQSNAINARNRNILVSAAAGSGKTAVLVERVISLITNPKNPIDIDKLLIVTFTNAAAAEMKSRIASSLNTLIKDNKENELYKRQLSLLSNAKICTVDAFCIELVRENFYNLSINQDFKIIEDSELQLIEDSVINEVIDEEFEKGNKGFIKLINAFTLPNNDKFFIDLIKRILRFIYAQPFPYKWLDRAISSYSPDVEFNKTIWYEYINVQLKKLFDLGKKLIEENRALVKFEDEKLNSKFNDLFDNDLTEFTRFENAYKKSWNDLVYEREAKFATLPPTTKIDSSIAVLIKNNREIYKGILTKEIPSFFVSDQDEYKNDMTELTEILCSLSEIVKECDKRIMLEKRERNSFSFSDTEHFAIDLLFKLNEKDEIIKTDLADNLSSSFYEILVDEYQDTNEAQDLLYKYLSNGKNLFAVGDIKQSIYRFRLAMPHIFNQKKKEYLPYNEFDNEIYSKIILDRNFRSRKGICSFVNFIFSNIMSEEIGELDYSSEEFLNCGAEYKESSIPSAQIKILNGVKGEDTDKLEATYIAQTIINKINSKEQIKDGDTYRDIRYGDFVILIRSLKSHINNYSEVLTEYGIPVICDNSTNLFDNQEIKMLMSLLRTIDNPTQDIPLLSTMMSPFYGFTPQDMAEIKIESRSSSLHKSVFSSKNQRVIDFLNDISALRKISVTMSVAGFIRYLVDDKGLVAYINAMGNGEQRYQNILKLISFANNFDNGVNVGLTAFVRYIDKIIASDKNVESAKLSVGNEDAVTIMSVHHSKGLEFPVCIYAGTNRQYNKSDLYDKLLLNTHLGLGIKCHNEESLYQYKTIPYAVIKDKNTIELMSENLRVLYVALTRAKEQFITFITCDNLESKIKKLSSCIIEERISPYMLKKRNSDAELFLLCSLLHPQGKVLRDFIDRDIKPQVTDFDLDIEIKDEIMLSSDNKITDFVPANEGIIEQIKNKLDFSYEGCNLQNISAKLTASTLDSVDRGFEYITSSKPSFMNKAGLTPAQRGTAMHCFMQHCSFNDAKSNLDAEIVRLVDNGFITSAQAESLDKDKLNSFFNSELYNKMAASNNIYREIKVSSFVKANQVYDIDSDENILVQGIADCVFEEDDGLVLVDYKTDYVKDESELLEKYKKQIMFYKDAVSKTLKMDVKQAILYSFSLNKVCCYK